MEAFSGAAKKATAPGWRVQGPSRSRCAEVKVSSGLIVSANVRRACLIAITRPVYAVTDHAA